MFMCVTLHSKAVRSELWRSRQPKATARAPTVHSELDTSAEAGSTKDFAPELDMAASRGKKVEHYPVAQPRIDGNFAASSVAADDMLLQR